MLLIIWSHLSQKTNTITTFGHFVFNLILFVQMGENILIICIFLIFSFIPCFWFSIPFANNMNNNWYGSPNLHLWRWRNDGHKSSTKRFIVEIFEKKKTKNPIVVFNCRNFYSEIFSYGTTRRLMVNFYAMMHAYTEHTHRRAREKKQHFFFAFFFTHSGKTIFFIFLRGLTSLRGIQTTTNIWIRSNSRPTKIWTNALSLIAFWPRPVSNLNHFGHQPNLLPLSLLKTCVTQ